MDVPTQITVNGRSFEVRYTRSLKTSSSVRIRGREVHIGLSRFLLQSQRDKIVGDFLKWARRKLKKLQLDTMVLPEYKDGGRIVTHNRAYDLKIFREDRQNSSVSLRDGVICVRVSKGLMKWLEKAQYLAEKVIMKDQLPYLCEVLDELNQLCFREKYGSVRFKRMKTRFGSCSSKRNLNFAYRLLFAPREVFRYVCVHELAHLKEMNHSKRFWALVEEAMPDYKEADGWVRDNGFMLG